MEVCSPQPGNVVGDGRRTADGIRYGSARQCSGSFGGDVMQISPSGPGPTCFSFFLFFYNYFFDLVYFFIFPIFYIHL